MNYRHIYHAGNFADVLKHIVLTRILEHLKKKDKAFRVIDTHAGIGRYDLSSTEAQKTGEWRDGIGRLAGVKLNKKEQELLKPYLDSVFGSHQKMDALTTYPGSPLITRRLLREQDRLTACELHKDDIKRLAQEFEGDIQSRILHLDGWLAFKGHLPPKEKRGLVLVDPPFEEMGEFDRLLKGLYDAHPKWQSGIYALWYPIKHLGYVGSFRKILRGMEVPDIIDITLTIGRPHGNSMDGCGMIVVNPPFTLEQDMLALKPLLQKHMAREGEKAELKVTRLRKE